MHAIATMCRVLGVSASGYYARLKRPPSARAQADAELSARIAAIHQNSRATYGAPRIHAELAAEGLHIGCKRVARLMASAGLHGASRRKWIITTVRDRDARPAPDLVERNFAAPGPNRLWVADITYIPTWAGFLYLAVVLDVFSRRIVGWAMETYLRTELVLKALDMALGQRRPAEVIHHSDQGSQGGLKRSSQHLEEELRWLLKSAVRIDLGEQRCGRRDGLRWRDGKTISSFGQRLRRVVRVKRLRSMPGCRRPWAVVGSGGQAACHRHIFCGLQSPYRAVIYRLPSAKRSPSCGFRSMAFAPLPASSGGLLRRSRASCAGMPRHAAADWNIGPPPRNGMLIVRCAVPNRPSWRGMKRYAATYRTGLQARSLRLTE